MLRSALRLLSCGLPALFTLASPALAQDARQPPTPNNLAPPEVVVVTGNRPKPETLDTVVRNYVSARAGFSPKIEQVTRWVAPVCPEVKNLPAGFGTFITVRIKAIAASVGAPVREGCTPNIEIIFTAQPQAIMDRIVETKPILLGYHFVHEARSVAKVTQPIQAWYVTATSNGANVLLDDAYHGSPGGTVDSRLTHGLKSGFAHVLILANTDILAGHPIGPVADYIAMLALAQSRAEDDCSQLPSILDLFSTDCPDADKPESLTIADKAYLEGLYGMDSLEVGTLQRDSISGHMIQSLGGK